VNQGIGKWVRVRLALVGLGLGLLGLIICGRFFYLQVILGPELREEATREYQKSCPVLPVRGMIQDRKGLELAISTRVSSVVAHPTQIKQAGRLSKELAPILGFKPRELKEILTRATSFVWVKRHLTPEREAASRPGPRRRTARPRPPRLPAAGTPTPSTCCLKPNATIRSSLWPVKSWGFATWTVRDSKG
jgi:hypothetical protein